jgi:hypothetical protein
MRMKLFFALSLAAAFAAGRFAVPSASRDGCPTPVIITAERAVDPAQPCETRLAAGSAPACYTLPAHSSAGYTNLSEVTAQGPVNDSPPAPAEAARVAEPGESSALDTITVPSDSQTLTPEVAVTEEAEDVPPSPAVEARPPAVMPYLDGDEAKRPNCFLCELWQRIRSDVIAAIQELRSGSLFSGVGTNSTAGLTGSVVLGKKSAAGCPVKCCCPAGRMKMETGEQSEAGLAERVKAVLKKSGVAPAGVDTMEFRPSDAKRGEFDPKPL